MLTLLGTITGFIASLLPEGVKLYTDHKDKKHEITLLKIQMEQAKQLGNQQLEEVRAIGESKAVKALYKHASIPSGVRWIEALRGSVRPVITYGFFLLFATVKISLLYYLITTQLFDLPTAMRIIWDNETEMLFSAIMAFWFSSRVFQKIRS